MRKELTVDEALQRLAQNEEVFYLGEDGKQRLALYTVADVRGFLAGPRWCEVESERRMDHMTVGRLIERVEKLERSRTTLAECEQDLCNRLDALEAAVRKINNE